MDLLTCFTWMALNGGCLSPSWHPTKTDAGVIISANRLKPMRPKLPRSPQSPPRNMSITIKLLPYEILAGTATSYADIAITVANPTTTPIVVTVNQIDITAAATQTVLLRSTPKMLGSARQIRLQAGETRTVDVRLETPTQIYQPGQPVTAVVRYQRNTEPERITQSGPESVAFMIP